MIKVLYPGSFDPITKGHMNIIKQASELFGEVIIAILQNPAKSNYFFTEKERLAIIQKLYQGNENIKVIIGSGATVDLAKLYDCRAIVRGLRSLTDFDYEIQLANINKQISVSEVNTVCLFADINYQFTSSSMVKEVFNLGKDITNYVDEVVKIEMIRKRSEK